MFSIRSCATALWLTAFSSLSLVCADGASGPPLAAGKPKFLGCCISGPQQEDFAAYWNQVTPENAGKWGSVEATRDVMDWTELDAAYELAKVNGLPFRFHVLVWGSQQPAWIEELPPDEQLDEIQEWFAAVAVRYPEIDYVEVVNEPLSDPPEGEGNGNYLAALELFDPDETSEWAWVLNAFRMARPLFPDAKLVLNEYSIVNDVFKMGRYVEIIEALKAENLVDVVAEQAHAFSTRVPAATLRANLDTLAATGLPVMITELDVDGVVPAGSPNAGAIDDQQQVEDYQRIFPVFWEHPSVIGVTLWGFRPGLWRDAEGANLVLADGTEKPAMKWLRAYVGLAHSNPAPISVSAGGKRTLTVSAPVAEPPQYQWQMRPAGGGDWTDIAGANAASYTIPMMQRFLVGDYRAVITLATGGTVFSDPISVSSVAPPPNNARLLNLSTRGLAQSGDNVLIPGFYIAGSGTKRLLIRAVGPSLTQSPHFVTDPVAPDPQLILKRLNTNVNPPVFVDLASNDDWGDNANAAEITTTAQEVFAFSLKDSREAALLVDLAPGGYTVIAGDKNGESGIAVVELYDADPDGGTARLINISNRGFCGVGSEVMIPGFWVSHEGPKTFLIRVVGPRLESAPFNMTGFMADPELEIFPTGSNTPILTNDDWGDNPDAEYTKQVAADVFAFSLAEGSKDAALVVTLPPGGYTVVGSSADDVSTGIVLVEVYVVE